MTDSVRLMIVLFALLVMAPLTGIAIHRVPFVQKICFLLMLFLTMCPYDLVGISPWHTGEFFRGHSRGYEFTVMEIFAVILLFSGIRHSKHPPWIPPGMWLYLIYCFASSLSIINSIDTSLSMMAMVKFTKAILIYMAAFQFLREDKDIHFFLKTITVILIIQAGVCLYEKYALGIYQVDAWFSHQNAMGMYSYILGIPLLSVAMGMGIKSRLLAFYLVGYFASGICVQASLSRGGMAVFVVATGLVVALSFRDRITWRRISIVTVAAMLSIIALSLTKDTIIKRFHEPRNAGSLNYRKMLNHASKLMFQEHPIIGHGWNTYGILINPPYTYGNIFDQYEIERGHDIDENQKPNRPISESWYYLMLAETGTVGLVTCFVFFITLLFWCGRIIFTYPKTFRGTVAIGFFSSLGISYLHCILERTYTEPKNLVTWMICLAVIAHMEWKRRSELKVIPIKKIQEPNATYQVLKMN